MNEGLMAALHGRLPEKEHLLVNRLGPVENAGGFSMDLSGIGIKTQVRGILGYETNPLENVFGKDKYGTIKARSVQNSRIMVNHLKGLPLVPGVIQKGLLIELCGNDNFIRKGIIGIRTEFLKPILPGNIIIFGDDKKSLCNEKGEVYVKIEETQEKPEFNELYEDLEEQLTPIEEQDKYLLQTGDFRFVSGFTWINNEDKANPQVGDIFQGYFNIPKDFIFTEEEDGTNIVPYYLIEEFAAQIGSFGFGEKLNVLNENGIVDEEKRNVLTFKSSISKYTGLSLTTIGETFKLVGRMTQIEKREASFEYVGYNSEGLEVIRGKITGNIVPLKILKRYIK